MGDPPLGHDGGTLDTLIGRIGKLCGAAALAVRGAEGARALLDALYPVNMDSQLDLKLSSVVDWYGRSLRLYCSANPLAAAPLSEAGDSDIQRIPEARQGRFRLEAAIRHEIGDTTSHDALSVEELVHSGRLDALVAQPGMPQLAEEQLYNLVVEVYKSLEYMKRPAMPRVMWSLSNGFVLAGSWNQWQEPFMVLQPTRGRAHLYHAEVDVRELRGGPVEFQVLVAGEWNRRFFPMEERRLDANILGPLDRHGYNFSRAVPSTARCMHVAWKPTGMRQLDVTFTS